jgi:hypothetical protein
MDKITQLQIDGKTYQVGSDGTTSNRYPSPTNRQTAPLYTNVTELGLSATTVFSSTVDGDSAKAARRIPVFMISNTSKYLAACEARTSLSDSSQIDILFAYKNAADSSWTYKTLFAYDSSSKYKYMNPSLCVDRNGVNQTNRIYVFCMKFQITDSNNGNWLNLAGTEVENVYKYSDDDGANWSDEQSIGSGWTSEWKYSTVSYGNSVFMKDGTLVIPCMGMNSSGKQHSGILYQKKGDTTWTYSCPSPKDGENECTAYENDEKLYLNTRNSTDSRCIYEYDFTNDKFTLIDDSFVPNAYCGANVEEMTVDGVHMYTMAFIDTTSSARTNPTAWVSADGIIFSRAIKILDANVTTNAGYCVCSSYNGYVGFIYEYNSNIYFVDLTSNRNVLTNGAAFLSLSDQYNIEISKANRFTSLEYLFGNINTTASSNTVDLLSSSSSSSSAGTVMIVANTSASTYTIGTQRTTWPSDWNYKYIDVSKYQGKKLNVNICNVSPNLGIGFTSSTYKASGNTFLSVISGTNAWSTSEYAINIPDNAVTMYYDIYNGTGDTTHSYTFTPKATVTL